MEPNPTFAALASDTALARATEVLQRNGFGVDTAENGAQAKEKALTLIPAGAEVMTMTSVTLEAIGLAKHLDESGTYNAIRPKLMKLDWKTQANEMRKLAAAPDWVVGSVHAVTEDGHVLIASNTGSQLAAYAYTGGKILWVVGTQKIVRNTEEGFRRLAEYTFPLEDARAQKAYGMHSGVNKVLLVNKEIAPGRITILFVKERLGF